MIGEEPHRPYDRPPLSKEVLAGAWPPERTALRDEPGFDGLGLDWRLGRRAVGLDVDARVVELDDGERIVGDRIVVATGASPRQLPDTPPLDGIFTLRTVDDARAIEARLRDDPKVVVVGAGFIGSEVAATCAGRGLTVTVLEALPVPLERVLGPAMGGAVAALHHRNGVDLRCGVGVAGFEGESRVERVRLADGDAVDADLVVVGIGVVPNTAWLEGSGLDLADGVVCDETSLAAPGIVAAGDVSRWSNPLFDEQMRVEHWTNAAEQGMYVGRRVLAAPDVSVDPYAPVPFFWSDQYDVKIQFAGHVAPGDRIEVVHGDPEAHRFVAVYGRGDRVVGALALSMPRELMAYRRLIAGRASWAEALDHANRTAKAET